MRKRLRRTALRNVLVAFITRSKTITKTKLVDVSVFSRI